MNNALLLEWSVRTVIELVPAAANRATPDEPNKPIGTAMAARKELLAQADALLRDGRVSAEQLAAELKRISLTAPASEESKTWRFKTEDPDTYIWIVASKTNPA